MKYVLSFDLGTGSVKASLFGENAENVSNAVVSYTTEYADGGIREQNPDTWWEGVNQAARELLRDFPHKQDIAAIGLSGHSLGVVAVNKAGKLLTDRTPIWSDARAVRQAERFFRKVDHRSWYETTGCGFPTHLYALFKMMWYQELEPALYAQTAAFIGSKDYINLRLTGVIATDASYASGSGAYSLSEHRYRPDYIAAAGIDAAKLPPVFPSSAVIGSLREEIASAWGLSSSVAVVAGGVDNACMSLGAGCFAKGDVYASLGSSAWIAASTDTPVVDYEKKIYTWEHCVPGQYLPSAGIFSSGTALDWVKAELFGDCPYDAFDELAKTTPAGANGVLFCPVLSGGSGVDAAENMKGCFAHFDLRNTRADLARATYEGMAYELSLAMEAIASRIPLADTLQVVGGGAKSRIGLQIYADVLEKEILSSTLSRHAASFGAAALALVGAGIWPDYTGVRRAHQQGDRTEKINVNAAFYRKRKEAFLLACRQMAALWEQAEG